MSRRVQCCLIDRKLGLTQFTDAKVNDPRIRDLMKRVTMREHRDWGEGDIALDHPDVVTVTLNGGGQYSHAVRLAKGHADNPLTWDELHSKFQECAGLMMQDEDVARVRDMVSRLETRDDIKELMHVLHRLPVR